mgnify:CR=1 FL=1
MDPNQNQTTMNTTAPQVPSAPAGNVPPVPMAPPSPVPPETPKSNGKILLFIAVGILLLIVLGVIYFMATQLNNQNKTEGITPIPTQALPISTPTPTPLSEKDIDTIDLGNPEADLKSIDEDVKQL